MKYYVSLLNHVLNLKGVKCNEDDLDQQLDIVGEHNSLFPEERLDSAN